MRIDWWCRLFFCCCDVICVAQWWTQTDSLGTSHWHDLSWHTISPLDQIPCDILSLWSVLPEMTTGRTCLASHFLLLRSTSQHQILTLFLHFYHVRRVNNLSRVLRLRLFVPVALPVIKRWKPAVGVNVTATLFWNDLLKFLDIIIIYQSSWGENLIKWMLTHHIAILAHFLFSWSVCLCVLYLVSVWVVHQVIDWFQPAVYSSRGKMYTERRVGQCPISCHVILND